MNGRLNQNSESVGQGGDLLEGHTGNIGHARGAGLRLWRRHLYRYMGSGGCVVSAKLVGYWKCSVGGEQAEVLQGNRQGNHFMTRCGCCGFSQATGRVRQQKIWDEARFTEVVKRPVNVVDQKPPVNEPEPVEKPTEAPTEPGPTERPNRQPESTDFDPDNEPEPTEPAASDGRSVRRYLLAGVAFLSAAGAAALWNI